MELETVTLKIGGMACDACVGHVERALTGLAGVRYAEVDLAGGSASVQYDPAQTSPAEMKAAIEDEGYDAD